MSQRLKRVQQLIEALSQRILVLDGAMGTALQEKNLTAQDFGGVDLEGCNENLILTRPDIIRSVHASYLEAGADILETNTFGSTPLVLGEYGLSEKASQISFEGARLAREVADAFSTPEKIRFVAGSMGPTTKALSVTGGITFDGLIDNFYLQAKGLYEGGVDYFLLETCQDTRNIKAGILGIQKFLSEVSDSLPIAVSVTIEPMGTLLAGQSIEALAASLAHVDLLYLGLNCATGPEFMTDHIRTLSSFTTTRVACVPNAGLPDENGKYLETPEMIARVLDRFIQAGWINLVGGCCGTTAPHIRALSEMVKGKKPRVSRSQSRSFLSGIDYLEITPEMRPVLVGERTNVIGSRKFKQLIAEGKYEEASEIGRAQVKKGAQIIDVCMADPDRDELTDMTRFLEHLIKKIRAPLMIDSTDPEVFEKALPYSQGKAILNSINLEEGEERFEKVIPMAKKFGAALVVGMIDEDKVQGMAVTRERKLEIAMRSYQLLTEKYGMKPEDIYWDCLVFPIGTGDANYANSAQETIAGIRLVKEAFPLTKTILGVSNVSFGLPPAGREVLNSVYLYHCVQAGLDLAIVNAEKLERYPTIPDEEKKLAEDLLFQRGDDPVNAFANYFRQKTPQVKKDLQSLPLNQRLQRYIIEGSKDGLTADLDEALKNLKPLEIINGPLMQGMDEVGRLFNKNELIVAEVLQSAEAMKAAVAHLEPHMDKADTAVRGKVLLATVKGDVHDIGKNLVDIILSNNGFQVINLGIKIPPEQIIAAIKEHCPDMLGLSGLLVKSAQQMVLTAEDLTKAGIYLPILVGGAALSRNFTDFKIAPAYSGLVAYASDAMDGLELAKKIRDPEGLKELKAALKARQAAKAQESGLGVQKKTEVVKARSSEVQILNTSEIPSPPDFDRHVIRNVPLDHLWPFINPLMLYGRHLGLKGKSIKQLQEFKKTPQFLDEEGKKALEVFQTVEEVKAYCRQGLMKPVAIYQYFKATSHENSLQLYDTQGSLLTTLDFPRQPEAPHLCLSDYTAPGLQPIDNVCLFVVSAGEGIRELAEKWKQEGKFLKSFALQALALETAEAYAEYLHGKIRNMWGFPDDPQMQMMDRFQAKYRGKRYSPGYPACPRLEDQANLFKLLRPEEIEVHLTEGFMMEPEASVSAFVFHHPQAKYFSASS